MSILLAIDSNKRSNLSDPTHNFTIDFSPAINLTNRPGYVWTIGLVNLKCWYSFYNLSAGLYNNTSFIYNATTYTIPDGVYNITQLNTTIQALIGSTNVSLLTLDSQLKIAVGVTAGTLDLSVGNFYTLLGFDAGQAAAPLVGPANVIGNNVADVTNGIDVLYVNCNVVNASFSGARSGQVLFSFVPNKGPGRNLDFSPVNVIYLPVNEQTGYLRQLQLYITDNLGRIVDFNNEDFAYILHLKEIPIYS